MIKLYRAVYVASISCEGAFVGGTMSGLNLYAGGRVDVSIHDFEESEGTF